MDSYILEFQSKMRQKDQKTRDFYFTLCRYLPERMLDKTITIEELIKFYSDYLVKNYQDTTTDIPITIKEKYKDLKEHILNYIYGNPILKEIIDISEKEKFESLEFIKLITEELPELTREEENAFILGIFVKNSTIPNKENKSLQDFMEIYYLSFLHKTGKDEIPEELMEMENAISLFVTEAEKLNKIMTIKGLPETLNELLENNIEISDIIRAITESDTRLNSPTPAIKLTSKRFPRFIDIESYDYYDLTAKNHFTRPKITSTKFEYPMEKRNLENSEQYYSACAELFKHEDDVIDRQSEILKQIQLTNKKKADQINKNKNDTPYKYQYNEGLNSAIKAGYRNNNNSLNSTFNNLKSLGIKDALDIIPTFRGLEGTLASFTGGCRLAKLLIPTHMEPDFTKLIKTKLQGEALTSVEDHEFDSIQHLVDFLEKMFDKTKLFYEEVGDLAKIKQGQNESVIKYSNRVKELGRNITKAALREKRPTNKIEIERDLLKFFLKGLKSIIIVRMTPFHTTFEAAIEEALELERETENRVEEKVLTFASDKTLTCQFCKKPNHEASECRNLKRQLQNSNFPQNEVENNKNNYNNNFRTNNNLNSNNYRNFNRNNYNNPNNNNQYNNRNRNQNFNNNPNNNNNFNDNFNNNFNNNRRNYYKNNGNFNRNPQNFRNNYQTPFNQTYYQQDQFSSTIDNQQLPVFDNSLPQYFYTQQQPAISNQVSTFNPQPTSWNSNTSFVPQPNVYNKQQSSIVKPPISQFTPNNTTPTDPMCNYCKKHGHLIRDCVVRAENNARKAAKEKAELEKNANGTTN